MKQEHARREATIKNMQRFEGVATGPRCKIKDAKIKDRVSRRLGRDKSLFFFTAGTLWYEGRDRTRALKPVAPSSYRRLDRILVQRVATREPSGH